MKNLQVVTDRRWMVEELSTNSSVEVHASHGLEIPIHEADDAWWIAQGTATRFALSGMEWSLQAPGPCWTAELPMKYAGRDIEVVSFAELRKRNPSLVAHIKFAEAKSDLLQASVRTVGEAVAILEQGKTPDGSLIQLSEPLELGDEWRFYVLDKSVVSESHYLTRAGGQEQTYYEHPDAEGENFEGVRSLVREVASRMSGPSGYVLDVALTSSGEPVVLEANPAWCAAWYGASIDEVVATIIASCKPSSQWEWSPDESLQARYGRATRLPWRAQRA